ncbi:MAG TPA: tetratricopeptide repeat protein [Bryobacteraceae bacterium]|jgi:tetratricopeptide (TPR) repeat protein|nr:tetratricopeptide repeat protein [Bryobacteraceae bacterium]
MLELWLKLKASAKFAAWAAPQVQQWQKDREFYRVEGDRQLKARNYADAEVCLMEAVAECIERGSSPTTRIRLQLQLAEAQRKQGPSKFDDAEATIRTALELTARISNPSGYVQCVDALAEVFHDRGDFAATQCLVEEGVRIEAAMPHPDPIRMARRVQRLGVVRHLQGEDGIPALEKAIELFEQAYGEEHVETAGVLSETGVLYRAAGRHEDAQRCLRRALRIHEREHGANSQEAVRDLHNLAGSHEEAGDIESAASLYERALELKDRIVGGDQEELAEMQFGVAGLYIDWGNYSRARELLTMCIGTFKRKKGARLAVAYELMAHVEEYSGRFRDALAELERAAKAWETCGPERNAELATNMEYRAVLLDQMKKKDSANWLREKAAEARAASAT